MKAIQIVASNGGSQGERLMDELDYGFNGSDLSNTSNMEDSVSNVLGDDEYSNFRLLGIGKASQKQIVRKTRRQEKRAMRHGGGVAAPSDAEIAAMESESLAADTAAAEAPAPVAPTTAAPSTTPEIPSGAGLSPSDTGTVATSVTTPTVGAAPSTSTNSGATPSVTDDKIFGLSKPVFYGLAGVAALVVGFVIYKKINPNS